MFKNKKVFIWQGGYYGGAETIMLEMAEFLSSHFNIQPVLGIFSGERDDKINFEQIEVPRLFPKRLVAYNTIAASMLLGNKLNNFDLVLTHSGGFWKRKNNFFIYREPGDLDSMLKSLSLKSKIIYLIPYWIAIYSLKKANLAISASRKSDHFFERHGIKDFFKTNNFIDVGTLPLMHSKQYDAGEIFNIVFIGRNDKIKNLQLLLDSINQIKDKNIKLHVFGVEGETTSSIKFYGWQSAETINEFISRKAHLFVLPSLFEAGPLSLLKSLTLGLPSICSNNALPLEFIKMVPSFITKKSLIENIIKIKSNYEDYKSRFADYSQIIRLNYNREKVLKKEFDYILNKIADNSE